MRKNSIHPLVQAHRDGKLFPPIRRAYYVASSAVTSAAINDMPDFASLPQNGGRGGRVSYSADASPQALAIVRLSGLAGVHLLSRENMTAELALACAEACLPDPQRLDRHRGRDSIEAVCQILRVEPRVQGLELFDRAQHYLNASGAVVGSLWTCVQSVVDALLERNVLGRRDLMRIMGPFQIYRPAYSQLCAYGLAPG